MRPLNIHCMDGLRLGMFDVFEDDSNIKCMLISPECLSLISEHRLLQMCVWIKDVISISTALTVFCVSSIMHVCFLSIARSCKHTVTNLWEFFMHGKKVT